MEPIAAGRLRHLAGIDSIRFICALWVVLFHQMQSPWLHSLDRHSLAGRTIGAVLDCAFCGPAAVIVFFVISGLCIHFPYASGARLNVGNFIVRRYLRIGLPMFAAVGLSLLIMGESLTMWRLLLWSLYCEMVYYTAYPWISRLAARVGWASVSAVSILPCAALTWSQGFTGMYAGLNVWDPILGLPCWLLGCLLAEAVAKRSDPEAVDSGIWKWRMGAWAFSSFSFGLMLHTGFGFPVSLPIFAAYCFFWLRAEVRAFEKTSRIHRILESLGAASYSLYLTHPLAGALLSRVVPGLFRPPSMRGWLLSLVVIGIFAALFYAAIERPSHRWARNVGRVKL